MSLKTLKSAVVASLLLGATAAPVMAADYEVDLGHSTVQFVISHLGFSDTVGRFNEFSGNYSINDQDPRDVKVSFEVKTSSIDTNHTKRDQHLRSPDFFDAKQFPTMSFVSTGYEGDAQSGKLTGKLTLLGVTKPVTFEVQKVGEGKDPWGGYRSGFNASATIDRTEFGMNYFAPNIPGETRVNLFLEGIRK